MTICDTLPRTGTHEAETMNNEEKWEALGGLLRRQRVVVLGIRSRAEFARERGVSDSVVRDLESGRRDNYDIDTLLSLESWYGLTPDELRTVLGDIYPMHETLTPHAMGTIASSRSDDRQTEAQRQASVDQLLRTLDAMREELLTMKRGEESASN